MKRKLLGLLITLNVLAPVVHADEPFSIPASAVNTQAFDEPPDSAKAMDIVTNAVKQVPGALAVTQPPINSNQPPINPNRRLLLFLLLQGYPRLALLLLLFVQ